MKRFSTSGLTAAGVLVLALSAGAAGGAMVLGNGGGSDAPPASTTLHQVSDATATDPAATPEPAASTAPEATPAPVVSDPVQGTAPSSDADQAAQRAEDAAKRSEDAAKRSEDAADRTEKGSTPVTEPTTTEPAPAPEATPKPTPTPECEEGATRGVPYHHNGNMAPGAGTPGEDTCINGKWVRTTEPIDAQPPSPTPVAP